MSESTRRFERLVLRLLVVLVVLLIAAVVYVVATWPGAEGVFSGRAG